ncbi:MAG: C40 family peptidase [Muribaculum sp.]|nr:C40 family peptidase [Muribaculum sp.]
MSKTAGAKDSPTVVLPKDMAEDMRSDQRKLVEEALTWLGTPYRYGGKSRSGTDCSGMTMVVYRDALGIALPRSSREQQKFCKSIKKSALDAGDLIFFSTGRDKSRVSHVGMYIGDNKFIHASGSRGVIVSDIGEKYYAKNYHSSGHVARSMDREKKPKEKSKPEATPAVESTPGKYEITLDRFLELNKRQNEIDEAIEAKVDSIYSSFLE